MEPASASLYLVQREPSERSSGLPLWQTSTRSESSGIYFFQARNRPWLEGQFWGGPTAGLPCTFFRIIVHLFYGFRYSPRHYCRLWCLLAPTEGVVPESRATYCDKRQRFAFFTSKAPESEVDW